MKSATVRDLRYRFREIEDLLARGEVIEITKRRRVIARISPVQNVAAGARPDFMARLRKIYGNKMLAASGPELVAQERDRY